MAETQYRKEAFVGSGIARGMLGAEIGGRIPTINEYTEKFGCSRGVVQNALQALQQNGAFVLDKRGKNGTFLAAKNEEKLFEAAGVNFITGSMPAPLNLYLAGLATGICQAMTRCIVPFTFAFVQGSGNRADALRRKIYDFAVVTLASAKEQTALYPELDIAFALEGSQYSMPYTLYLNREKGEALQDGMSIAVDPKSTDQWGLTKMLSEGKSLRQVQLPYISTWAAFLAGEVDAVVHRQEMEAGPGAFSNLPNMVKKQLSPAQIKAVPVRGKAADEMQQPVVLMNRGNEGIGAILENYLDSAFVAYIQGRVLNYQMSPQFY